MRYEQIHLKDIYPFLGENGRDPVVSLYLRNRSKESRPSILLCPGGGYQMVSSLEGEPVALKLFAQGYNVFILNYSVKPHGFPTQLREVAAVMELISQNSEDWNTDPERIAIMGFSAGGHLAAHYSNSFDLPEVREVFPESKPVKATILCYAVTNWAESGHKVTFLNLVGHRCPESEEEKRKFSCCHQVTERTPPAFLWHTAGDTVVPATDSLLYAKALAEHNIPFALHVFPAGQHGLSTVEPGIAARELNPELTPEIMRAAAWLPLLTDWLKDTL